VIMVDNKDVLDLLLFFRKNYMLSEGRWPTEIRLTKHEMKDLKEKFSVQDFMPMEPGKSVITDTVFGMQIIEI